MQIGNGLNTRIEDDIWVGSDKIRVKPGDHDILPLGAKVADIMTSDRRWNVRLIWQMFEAHDVGNILATHIPSENSEDISLWNETKNGHFTLKSCCAFSP